MWRAVRAAGWSVWYRRKPETILGKVLTMKHAWLMFPIVFAAILVIGIAGIVSDVFVGAHRVIQRAKAIRERE